MTELAIPSEYEGSLCEIKTTENTLIATGKIEKINRSGVKIKDRHNDMNMLPYGQSLKINVFNTKLGFRAFVGSVYTSSKGELYLTDVVSLIEHERRNSFRVDVNLNTKIRYSQNSYEPRSGVADILLRDISLNGIKFTSRNQLGRLTVIDIEIDIGKRKPVSLQYKIVRIIGEGRGLVTYGCEYISDSNGNKNNDALCSYLFKKQHQFLNRK